MDTTRLRSGVTVLSTTRPAPPYNEKADEEIAVAFNNKYCYVPNRRGIPKVEAPDEAKPSASNRRVRAEGPFSSVDTRECCCRALSEHACRLRPLQRDAFVARVSKRSRPLLRLARAARGASPSSFQCGFISRSS